MTQHNDSGTYSVGEFSKLTGVTERTLRYYDRKGLLKPSGRNGQGHRYYRAGDLLELQRIATLKFLNFTLEEIGEHLQAGDQTLQDSLDMQYELLLRKREQLDRALATMERLRDIARDAGKVDNTLLLMFLHNIYLENEHREKLSGVLPQSFLDSVFMHDKEDSDKRELERKMTAILAALVRHCREGLLPDDPIVLAEGSKLIVLLQEVLGDSLVQLTETELQAIAELDDKGLYQTPIFSQMWLAEAEELFLGQVLEQLDVRNLLIGEQKGGEESR